MATKKRVTPDFLGVSKGIGASFKGSTQGQTTEAKLLQKLVERIERGEDIPVQTSIGSGKKLKKSKSSFENLFPGVDTTLKGFSNNAESRSGTPELATGTPSAPRKRKTTFPERTQSKAPRSMKDVIVPTTEKQTNRVVKEKKHGENCKTHTVKSHSRTVCKK